MPRAQLRMRPPPRIAGRAEPGGCSAIAAPWLRCRGIQLHEHRLADRAGPARALADATIYELPEQPARGPVDAASGCRQSSCNLVSGPRQAARISGCWSFSANSYRPGSAERPAVAPQSEASGTKSGRFDQTHLIASGGELAALIALHDNTTPGFDADHPGTNPAKSGRLQHLDNITGLQIQLHLRKHENGEQGSSNAPWRT